MSALNGMQNKEGVTESLHSARFKSLGATSQIYISKKCRFKEVNEDELEDMVVGEQLSRLAVRSDRSSVLVPALWRLPECCPFNDAAHQQNIHTIQNK